MAQIRVRGRHRSRGRRELGAEKDSVESASPAVGSDAKSDAVKTGR